MKSIQTFAILAVSLLLTHSVAGQDKEVIKELETHYGVYSHKKSFNDKWAMTKFQIVYKLSTAMVAKTMDKGDYAKVKSSAGAYALLSGITEEDLQAITDKVAENFIKRMKEEAGVEILTWSAFEDSKSTKKLKEIAEDPELYNKSQGLALTMTYDGTPPWNKVIAIVPGGKGLSKELGANHANLSMIIDFAAAEAEATAFVKENYSGNGWVNITYGESQDASLTPILGVRTGLGGSTLDKGNLANTSVATFTENLYSWYMTAINWGDLDRLASSVPYAESIEEFEGELPELFASRKNNKIEYVKTFVVKTTPELYEAAVMNATNRYFDDIIRCYNASKPKKK